MRLANVRSLLTLYMLAFLIRALPEIMSGPYPVGYDLLAGYAPALWAFPEDAPLKAFGWAWSPLAIYVLWFFWKLSDVDLYIYLKFVGPIFYGLFVSSFYYLLLKGLGWSERKSFVTAVVFLLQPSVLRTGWDQLREELGFLFLFILLAKAKCNLVKYAHIGFWVTLILSLFIVFSHQLVSVLFFVVVSWQFMNSLIRALKPSFRSLIAIVPSAIIFTWQLYSQFICPNFSNRIEPIQLPSGSNIFIFTNYFLSDLRFIGGDYWNILVHIGSLSLYVVVPLIPFAIKGFFKDNVFTPMLTWLIIASYSIIVFPYFAFSYYWWWIFLLPIPLTVYLGNALCKWGIFAVNRHKCNFVLAGVSLLGIISVGYASSAIRLGYPYAYTYMPSSLLESCVDFKDIEDIKDALTWVNKNLPSNAIVVVPEKFQGFASMHLRSDFKVLIAPSLLNLSQIVGAIKENRNEIFAIYYLKEIGNLVNLVNLSIFEEVGVYKIIF